MLDSDARQDAQKICQALHDKVASCINVALPAGKDPGDMTQLQIQELLALPQGERNPLLDKAQEVQALLAT
jgi:hypothetical protein